MQRHLACRIALFAGLVLLAVVLRPAGAAADATGGAGATTQPATQDSSGTADAPDESTRETFPLFGFSVIPPPYWTRAPEDRPARAALWTLDDPQTGRTMALIGIEAGPSGKHMSHELAAGIARESGRSGGAQRMDLDGIEAYECPVSSRPRMNETRAVRAIVCTHNGLMYYIEAAESGGASSTAILEMIGHTWKWIPFEAPVQHLGFRDAPRALTATLQISTPDVLRPPPPEQVGHGNPTLMAYDVLHARIDFGLDFKIIPREAGEDFATASKRMSQELSYVFAADPAIVISPRAGTPTRLASAYVNARMPGDKHLVRARFALVDLGDDGVGVLRFMLPPNLTEDSRKAYEATTEKMIDSLRPREPGAEDLPKPLPKLKLVKP
jgi:hypothetical protein